ncbi:MAG TPA: peptidyl-alpha-hydroxyglycine alpha-amidating lyase family protein [Bryobacteraceae bacterium]|nr:peptidyl-alpha-hydroxyglycine alpha-amidating lyase family protein [Bryobacteraceae bacterium]
MPHPRRVQFTLALAGVAMIAAAAKVANAPASYPPSNDAPNPYHTVTGWAQLPDGRKWGSTAGVDVGPAGNIWAYDRCGANSCADSPLDPILEFDKSGKVLRHFGAGLFVQPHGFFVDKSGNVWVTDDQAAKDKSKGLQVFKFSPDGKVLMTLGTKGVSGEGPDAFGAPTDVVVAPNGDIFVSDGHQGCNCPNARIVKFSKDGKFIKAFGKKGSGPGEFDGPHALAFDSKGRLFVGDRSNNRIQIFDQDGNFIAAWTQFGRPSGIFIDKRDTLYVTDSESRDQDGYGHNPGCHRGIRIGSLKDGKVIAFIPDPDPKGGSSISEGVAVDHDGNVYGAEVGPRDLKKYVKN